MPFAIESPSGSAKTPIDAKERLIFALDVPTLPEASALVQKLDGVVTFFKIGIELYMGNGLDLIPDLTSQGKRVFLDLKYYDVPETVKKAVRRVAALKVSFLTIHGNGKIIQAATEGRGGADLGLLSVTALTSLDDEDMREMGFHCAVKDLVLRRAQRAMEAGCDGVIASSEEASEIRKLAIETLGTENKFLIVTPGIRPANASHDDHKRSGTPEQAIRNGADYLVVGRPIKDSPDPRRAAAEIIAEMQAAFDNRR